MLMQTDHQAGYPSVDKPWLRYYTNEELDIEIPNCSVYENLYQHTKCYGKNIAIEYLTIKVSFDQLFSKIDKAARALIAAGVKPGDIVSVCLPNIPEAIYCFYAINKIGAIANMLDVRCGTSTLENAIIDAKSKVLIYLDSITDKFLDIKDHTSVETVVAVSPIDCFNSLIKKLVRIRNKELKQNIPNGFITWTDFVHKTKTIRQEECVVQGESDAAIAYTGGTTGEPKGVIATNKNIVAVAEMELKVGFNQEVADSILCMAPPWTYYGICNSIHAPFCTGLKVVLIPKFGPDELGDLIKKHRPNLVVTVPSALSALLSGKYNHDDFSFLKALIVGADKLDEYMESEVNTFLEEHGSTIHVSKGYGMTEVMAAASYSKLNANSIGSVGIPYPLNIISTFKENGNDIEECKIGEQGEIAIYGPTVMRSYFGKFKEENSDILKEHKDGKTWAHTGDIGYIGDDGRVYIVGRIKRMFVKAGFKVFPATIEHCIMENEAVNNAAVVSVKDSSSGFATKAYIVLKDPTTNTTIIQKEIEEKVSNELYDYEIPDVYTFVDHLPLTGMGKIDYKALEKMG